jgi:hypothetical protein
MTRTIPNDTSDTAYTKTFYGKPLFTLAAFDDSRIGSELLDSINGYYPYVGSKIVATYTLHNFSKAFINGKIVE